MDWKELAGDLAKAGAPIIGSAVGGPMGGVIGSMAGKFVADALGVDATPEAVSAAIAPATAATPDPATAQAIADRLATAEDNFAAAMAKVGADEVHETGETARAELVAGTPFQRNWRPLNGYVLAYLTASYGTAIVLSIFAAIFTGRVEAMKAVFDGVASVVFFLSVPGSVVGATSIGRSFEKVKAIGLAGSGSLATVGKMLVRKQQ